MMMKQLRAALASLAVLTVLTGFVYPLVVTGIAQVVFREQANGGLVLRDGHVIGSRLIGQPFDDPKYFWGRLSATGPSDYNAAASSGSNYGPMSDALLDAVKSRVEALRAADPENANLIPVDLVTASASGLDPHISPASAEYQIARVARVRGLTEVRVREVVARHTSGRQLRLLGEPTVNVLSLNLELDALDGK